MARLFDRYAITLCIHACNTLCVVYIYSQYRKSMCYTRNDLSHFLKGKNSLKWINEQTIIRNVHVNHRFTWLYRLHNITNNRRLGVYWSPNSTVFKNILIKINERNDASFDLGTVIESVRINEWDTENQIVLTLKITPNVMGETELFGFFFMLIVK